MLRVLVFFCTSLFMVGHVNSKNINLTISDDLPSDIVTNIKSHLGELPNTELERISFLHAAKTNTINALQALGYYQSHVELITDKEQKNDVWEIVLDISLNAATLINTVNIQVNNEASNDATFSRFIKDAPIHKNDILNHGIYNKIKADILSMGLERGYFDGKYQKAQIAITPDNLANIDLTYNSGDRYNFGDIKFINNTINQNVIDKLIPFKSGDNYQLSKLQKLQNNLEKTQYFSNIVIVPQKESTQENVIPIQISLENAKRHYFDVGLGYATDTDFRVSTSWKTPLVNKYGHRQETRLKYSKINPTGKFTYSIPINNSLSDMVQLKLLLENDEYGDIESNYWSSRVSKKKTLNDLNAEAYIRFLHEEWDVNNVTDTADYFLLGYSWSYAQRTGPIIDPSSGFSQFYNIEGTHTAISSETSFIKFNAHWRNISTLAPGHRLVTRAEVGYTLIGDSVNDEKITQLSPSLRFFAGGDQSIRGFNYQSIGPTQIQTTTDGTSTTLVVGGTRLLVASIEYQYYFTDNIRGAVFFDAGSSFNEDNFSKSYSVGPGIHYISPIGAIKLDIGYSISEDSPSWRIHLNLGAEL